MRTALCGGWVALLGLIQVACSTVPQKSVEETARDEALADRIYSTLNADPIYYYKHVNVRVDDGVALLSGYVWSVQAIYRARQLAGSVPGIARVSNQMELERNGAATGTHSR